MIAKIDAAHLLAGLDLGSSVAESDNLLETARVETSVFDDLLTDRIDLIPGTKGSGKTALYRMFVDFLPNLMLQNKRVVIAHGVQQRQDTVFLAYKKQFDQLSEADFVSHRAAFLPAHPGAGVGRAGSGNHKASRQPRTGQPGPLPSCASSATAV